MQIGTLKCDFKKRFYVMGILNVTPDSFSDGGQYNDPGRAIDRVHEMIAEGVDMIDVGGESTRPGAKLLPYEEEIQRIQPAIKRIRQEVDVPLSIDTRKSQVAHVALDEGVDMVNDVSAATFDPEMAYLVKEKGAPIVLMHMRGSPETMQSQTDYGDVAFEVKEYLQGRIQALVAQGVKKGQIIVDPGFGFAKDPGHNWQLMNRLETFQELGCPLLIGVSNKSFINKTFGDSFQGKLEVNLALAVAARLKGAGMIRVHQVAPTVKIRKAMEALEKVNEG